MHKQHVFPALIMALILMNCSSNSVGVFEKIEKSTMEKTIDKYMGTPYQWGGNTPGKGVDCSGLTYSLYKSQEVDLPRVSRLQYAVGDGVSRNKLKYGDLVFFDTLGKGVSHVGMYVGDDKMVHASSSKGVTQSPIDTDYWRKRYIGARRIVGSPLASGETSVERHILAASYPMTIRRLIDIPTTDIIDNSFFGLDVQTDVNGNLRLASTISFWNFLEIGAEGQINQFLGHGSLGLEIPFVNAK
ncbi:MAG: C40 family peptidase, partial [Candidatus Marinimicrobia bacterium]|nr:C40 family peptidase [Candidatus Neomarinimicrobiota bacterium]